MAGEGWTAAGAPAAPTGAGDPTFSPGSLPPFLVFSHLRWDFVRQRPQHLLSRFARETRVWMWEEPIPCDHHLPYLEHHHFPGDDVVSLRPRLPRHWQGAEAEAGLRDLLAQFARTALPIAPVAWYYTPMMLGFSRDLARAATIYDCMDELSAFAFADPQLIARETELLGAADVVFTGGRSLYEAKRDRHGNVHAFPSAVDTAHFAAARDVGPGRSGGPVTVGYFGVIDERLDLSLVAALAEARPDWVIEMVGPVVKIDPATLPRHPAIRWTGPADYAALPGRLAGWDAALMPFAHNAATRFISPTKTPEYLAGGRPVVSTGIADVIADYGAFDGVWIADDPAAFVAACDAAVAFGRSGDRRWLAPIDARLAAGTWDATFGAMRALIVSALSPVADETSTDPSPAPTRAADPLREPA